jgi:hypothetical protein
VTRADLLAALAALAAVVLPLLVAWACIRKGSRRRGAGPPDPASREIHNPYAPKRPAAGRNAKSNR